MSELRYKVEIFDEGLDNEQLKEKFMEHILDTAIMAIMIPLSIFTFFVHNKRFEKHSMLESTLAIFQHFCNQMTSEPDEYSIFPGDIAYYTLRCTRVSVLDVANAFPFKVQLEKFSCMHP
jgi:hypothetical protein